MMKKVLKRKILTMLYKYMSLAVKDFYAMQIKQCCRLQREKRFIMDETLFASLYKSQAPEAILGQICLLPEHSYKGDRLVPKLTEHHVMALLIPSIRVKHPTNPSASVALGFMGDIAKLSKASRDTTDLIICCLINYSTHQMVASASQEINYRSALTPKSPHRRW